MLLVTDGVLEAPAPDGAEFGEAGVQRVLDGCVADDSGSEDLGRRLLGALRAHTGTDLMTHDRECLMRSTNWATWRSR